MAFVETEYGSCAVSFAWFADEPLEVREQMTREVHAVSLPRRLDELTIVIALMTIPTGIGLNDSNGQRQSWCPWNPAGRQTNNFGYLEQQSPAPSTAEALGAGLVGSARTKAAE